jgi:hypothetical protein
MPLVQGLQNKLGKEKLAVLLLSVDEEYGSNAEAVSGMKEAMADKGVDLPCAIAPGGFADINSRFGFDGYGIVLIGPDGTVKGKDLRIDDVEALIR